MTTRIIQPIEKQGLSTLIFAKNYLLCAICLESVTNTNQTTVFQQAPQLFMNLLENKQIMIPEVYLEYIKAWSISGEAQHEEYIRKLLYSSRNETGLRSIFTVEVWNYILAFYRRQQVPGQQYTEQALEILQTMTQSDFLIADAVSFEHVISILCEQEANLSEAERLIDQLRQLKITPTLVTLRAIILLTLSQNSTSNSARVDDLFLELCDQEDSLRLCQSLLSEMGDKNYVLPFPVFKAYLQKLSLSEQRGSAEAAINLFKYIEKKKTVYTADLACFESLFKTFERSLSLSHAENAWNALKYMNSLRVQPSLRIFESLMWTWVNSRRPDAPSKCMNILEKIKSSGIEPTARTYNIVLKSWTRSLLPAASSKAVDLLSEIDTSNISANAETFALVGYAISKSKIRSIESVNLVENLYRRLCKLLKEEYGSSYTEGALTHLQSMHRSLLNMWCFHSSPDNLDKIASLLEAMSAHGLSPHPSVYSTVATAWGLESVHRSRTLLNKLVDRGVKGQGLSTAYNLLLTSGKRSISVSSAEDLFENMKAEFEPSIVSYNILLEAVGRSNSKDVIRRCDAILSDMRVSPDEYTLSVMMRIWSSKLPPAEIMSRAQGLFERIPSPSLACYSAMVSGWCRVDVSRASRLMDRMIAASYRLYYTESSIFFSLIDAVSKAKQPALADKLLRALINLSSSSKPDVRSVRSVLDAWAFAANTGNCGEKAHDLIDFVIKQGVFLDAEMLQSVIVAWNRQGSSAQLGRMDLLFQRARRESVVLTANILKDMIFVYGKIKNAAEKAEEVLVELLAMHKELADVMCFNVVISAWGELKWRDAGSRAEELFLRMKAVGIQPDVVTYSSLMSALSKNFNYEAVLKAHTYFQRMCEEGISPDTRAFTVLITIWSKAKHADSERMVQELFTRMCAEHCRPNVVTYTAMLNMYAKSNSSTASLQIIDIFDRIKRENLKLDTAGYSSLLSALGKSQDRNAPFQAETVFNEMILAGIRPDVTAWNILISIWARSRLDDRFTKVDEFFNAMLESQCQPNEYLIATLLKMWSFSKEKTNIAPKILSLYEYISASNIAIDAYGMKVLITALLKIMSPAAAFDKAEQLIAHMLDFGMMPDTGCFTAIIKADPSSKAYERGLRLVNTIKNAGRYPPLEIYRAILASLESLSWSSREVKAIKDKLSKELSLAQ